MAHVETAREAGLGVTIPVGEEGGDVGCEEGGDVGCEEVGEVVEVLRPDRNRARHPRRRRPRPMAALRDAGIVLEVARARTC